MDDAKYIGVAGSIDLMNSISGQCQEIFFPDNCNNCATVPAYILDDNDDEYVSDTITYVDIANSVDSFNDKSIPEHGNDFLDRDEITSGHDLISIASATVKHSFNVAKNDDGCDDVIDELDDNQWLITYKILRKFGYTNTFTPYSAKILINPRPDLKEIILILNYLESKCFIRKLSKSMYCFDHFTITNMRIDVSKILNNQEPFIYLIDKFKRVLNEGLVFEKDSFILEQYYLYLSLYHHGFTKYFTKTSIRGRSLLLIDSSRFVLNSIISKGIDNGIISVHHNTDSFYYNDICIFLL